MVITFFKVLRQEILPKLADLEVIKIWLAGCATGEEIYSIAILLTEAGLYDKTIIYATDLDSEALAKAKNGIYPNNALQEWTNNYEKTGGTASFSDYYSTRYDLLNMDKSLKKNVLFANHNLVTDTVFSEVDLIICRNVLIYFNNDLQNRVFKLFTESLSNQGILCLGQKETISLSKYSDLFNILIAEEKIYQKY